MTKRDSYEVGFAKPPRNTRFQPGRSGNPKGRPKGAKNFATAFEQELRVRVPVTENGRRRTLSKREVIAKQVVNRAVGGDLKALPLLLNETHLHENLPELAAAEEVFGGSEQQPVIDSIVQRIRAAAAVPAASNAEPDMPVNDPSGDKPEGAE